MIIDLSIIHDGVNMTVKSEAAKFNQTKPATIGLSRSENEEGELIEGIGEGWTTADLKQQASFERGNNNRIYRVINPFSAESFEPQAAFTIMRFYCLKLHSLLKPRTYQLRALFRIDSFDMTLKLLNYDSISAGEKMKFEKELRTITKHLKQAKIKISLIKGSF